MITVAQQTILPCLVGSVTVLAEFFFYVAEVGRKNLRVVLFVTLYVGAFLFQVVAGQTATIVHDAEMRFMNEVCELPLFCLDRGWREIDQPPLSLHGVNAVTFCA